MIAGTDVRNGMLLLIDGKVYKIITSELRGSAQAHKVMHLGLKSIPEGHYIERKYNPGEKVEQILPDRIEMEYVYRDDMSSYFMNTRTYEQLAVPNTILGNATLYIKENSKIQVELYKGQPINVVFPAVVTLKVISSPPGIHDGTDSTFKEAVLENSQHLLVPQFIKEGDLVEIDVESGKYLDRIKK